MTHWTLLFIKNQAMQVNQDHRLTFISKQLACWHYPGLAPSPFLPPREGGVEACIYTQM